MNGTFDDVIEYAKRRVREDKGPLCKRGIKTINILMRRTFHYNAKIQFTPSIPSLLLILTLHSLSGFITANGILSLSLPGRSSAAPSTCSISNPIINSAAKPAISLWAKCLPGQITEPPPN
jgi:hypothetical protein